MLIKIYQSFFDESQKEFVDQSFVPYDNCTNKNSELREYPIICDLYSQNKDFDGYWGLLSWRFTEKTQITGKRFIDLIESNPGYDVYHFNPYSYIQKLYRNPFTEGETHHPGMTLYINLLLVHLCNPMKIQEQIFDKENFIYCSFYVGNKRFWEKWMAFQELVLSVSKTDPFLNAYLYEMHTNHRENKLSNFSFVYERLVNLFLFLNKNEYKIRGFQNPLPLV